MIRFAAFALLVSVGSLRADPVTIANPGFETPVTAPGAFTVSTTNGPSGWSVYNTALPANNRSFGVLNPTGTTLYPGGAPQGSNVGVVFLMNTTNIAEAGLQQTLSSTLQANTRYTLRVAVGNIGNDPNPQNSFNFTGFPGYRIDLMAGGSVVASDINTLQPGEGQFLESTLVFNTGAAPVNFGQPLGIRLVNLNGPGIEVNFDNVRLDASPIPEPSTTALAATAVCGIVAFRRRRMNKQVVPAE